MPTSVGFPRSRRLTEAGQFSSVFRRGVRRSSPPLVVHAIDNDGQGPRLGLAISRKSLARAVDRNLVKRLAREVFRGILAETPSSDIVLSLRGRAGPINRAHFRLQVLALFKQLM